MTFEDLRGYLQRLETEGELHKVTEEVSIKYELGAICHRSLKVRGDQNKALLFENIEGYDIPIATNLLATKKRLAIAFEIDVDSFNKEWIRRTRNPIAPKIVDSGPCKEQIYLGDDVDLYKLPHPIWNGKDGGPYITLPCQISKDPITGERNAGIYRSMVHDKKTLGILAAPYRHIAQHWLRNSGKPLPIAIAIGLHPTIYMATASAFAKGVDEIAVAGGLKGSPFDLVKCETNDLEVPASSEIVIEGLVQPEKKHDEGPFGEYTGYYVEKGLNPIVEVTAITHRKNPIYQGTYIGRPPTESSVMACVQREAEFLNQVSLPGIKKIKVIDASANFLVVVSIKKEFDGYAKMVGMALLGSWAGRLPKMIIVVDEDIDPDNWDEVQWALGTRLNAERGVDIIKDVTGSILDPAMDPDERKNRTVRTSKLIIDATKSVKTEFAEACLPDTAAMDKVTKEWSKYGL